MGVALIGFAAGHWSNPRKTLHGMFVRRRSCGAIGRKRLWKLTRQSSIRLNSSRQKMRRLMSQILIPNPVPPNLLQMARKLEEKARQPDAVLTERDFASLIEIVSYEIDQLDEYLEIFDE
jgi:hypothetical protein